MDDMSLLKPEDSSAVLALFDQLYGAYLPFPPDGVAYFNSTFTSDNLLKICERPGAILKGIWRNDELVAFLQGAPPEGGVGTIVWLVVSPNWQKMGLGEKLFACACKHYREIGAHKLKLTAPTDKAVNFYKRIGMTQEGFHPSHWWKMDFWSLGITLC